MVKWGSPGSDDKIGQWSEGTAGQTSAVVESHIRYAAVCDRRRASATCSDAYHCLSHPRRLLSPADLKGSSRSPHCQTCKKSTNLLCQQGLAVGIENQCDAMHMVIDALERN